MVGSFHSIPGALDKTRTVPNPELSRSIRILLADDHAMVRQGIRALLERHDDLTVVGEAWDGQHACELAETLKPDVIVMDANMPHLDGIEATRRIKRKASPHRDHRTVCAIRSSSREKHAPGRRQPLSDERVRRRSTLRDDHGRSDSPRLFGNRHGHRRTRASAPLNHDAYRRNTESLSNVLCLLISHPRSIVFILWRIPSWRTCRI